MISEAIDIIRKNSLYFILAIVLTLLSFWNKYAAMVGFSFFLVLFLAYAFPQGRKSFQDLPRVQRASITVLGTLILIIPSLFLTLFFSAGIILAGNYFIIILIFMISQKIYAYFGVRPKIQQFSWLALVSYFLLGFLIIIRNNFTLDSLLSDASQNIALIMGFFVTISIGSASIHVLKHMNAIKENQIINQDNIIFIFFIIFFSFATIAALGEQDGISSLKGVSFVGSLVFLIGIPIIKILRYRRAEKAPRTIMNKIYRED